jgi:hypothetical protein
MRCYFHLVNGSEMIRDTDGLEVADADQARTEAIEAIQILAREDGEAPGTWSGWRLDICDASGTVLSSISLDYGGGHH